MANEAKSKLHQGCSFEDEIKADESARTVSVRGSNCCNGGTEHISFGCSINACVVPGGSINDNAAVYTDQSFGSMKYSESYGTFAKEGVVMEHKQYTARYLMLLIFSLCSMMNGFQWIQYSIINSIICCYYEVSVTAVNWTSVIFMLMYIPFNFPVIQFMKNHGLRFTLVLGAAGNCLSSCIQCLSLDPSRFYVVMISQIIASISQCFTLSVPPFIAALWFGSEEVSLACSVGVFGNQLGVALGFLIPSVLVNNDCHSKATIKVGLMYLAFGVAVVNTLLFLAVVFVFKDKPKKPPSLAEARKREKVAANKSLFKMMKDTQFILLFLAYGVIVSVYSAISTMLNQMVVIHFPGKEEDAGRMGLISVFTGMAGAIVCGYVLDRTHLYRLTSVTISSLSFISMVLYTVLIRLELHIWMQYVMIAFFGFFVTGYLPVGFEIGAEMTYPEPEGTSASLLNLSCQAFGIVITMFGSWLLQTYGDLVSNLFLSFCMLLGCILTMFIKCDLRRRKQYENIKQLEQQT